MKSKSSQLVKKLIAAAMMPVFAVSFCSCSLQDINGLFSSLSGSTVSDAEGEDNGSDLPAYEQIKESIRNFESNVKVYASSEDELKDSLRKAQTEPEFFYITGAFNYRYISGINVYSVDIEYKYDSIEEKISELKNSISDIIQKAAAAGTDYQKILIIHDWICSNVSYRLSSDDGSDQDIYGALVKGEAACAGYAKAFSYLCSQVGIESAVVRGTAVSSDGSSGEHAWNYVKLNEEAFYYDLTWDDSDDGKINYYYFGITSDEMERSHFPQSSEPESFDDSMDYYYINQYVLSSKSEDELASILSRQMNGRAEIKCSDSDVFQYLESIVGNGNTLFALFSKQGLDITHFTYAEAPDVYCLTIYY